MRTRAYTIIYIEKLQKKGKTELQRCIILDNIVTFTFFDIVRAVERSSNCSVLETLQNKQDIPIPCVIFRSSYASHRLGAANRFFRWVATFTRVETQLVHSQFFSHKSMRFPSSSFHFLLVSSSPPVIRRIQRVNEADIIQRLTVAKRATGAWVARSQPAHPPVQQFSHFV